MNIGEVCSREVYIFTPAEPVQSAVAEMTRRHVGTLVIVESKPDRVRPIGILTDRDILRGQLLLKKDLSSLTVGEVMTRDPMTIADDSGIAEGIAQMKARGVRRAPVVNDRGALVGIVSLDDLLPIVAEELNALAQLVSTQASREGAPRESAPGPSKAARETHRGTDGGRPGR